MKLYHFTSLSHLYSILVDGYLKLTESNIGSAIPDLKPFGEHLGPDVVWLTEQNSVTGYSHGLQPEKTQIRFTIETNGLQVFPWRDFAARHGINREWYRLLHKTGGCTSKRWHVSTEPIIALRWMEIYDMVNRTPIAFQ